MTIVSVDDLFTAGIGFDLVGAYLLGKGLLVSPAAIVRRCTTYTGGNPVEMVAQAEDRVNALAGVWSLAVGFLFQASGYAFSLGAGGPDHGWGRAAVAVALVGVVLVGARAVWLVMRPRMLKHVLVRIASTHSGAWQDRATLLLILGPEAGWPATADEKLADGAERYARRVFGIDAGDAAERDELRSRPA